MTKKLCLPREIRLSVFLGRSSVSRARCHCLPRTFVTDAGPRRGFTVFPSESRSTANSNTQWDLTSIRRRVAATRNCVIDPSRSIEASPIPVTSKKKTKPTTVQEAEFLPFPIRSAEHDRSATIISSFTQGTAFKRVEHFKESFLVWLPQ